MAIPRKLPNAKRAHVGLFITLTTPSRFHPVQSHGIAGVQARHYDGHDYMDEKRDALALLLRLLQEQSANVVHIKSA